jgi:hypothetical protein
MNSIFQQVIQLFLQKLNMSQLPKSLEDELQDLYALMFP